MKIGIRRSAVALGVVAVMLVSGCGNETDSTSTSSPVSEPSAATSTTDDYTDTSSSYEESSDSSLVALGDSEESYDSESYETEDAYEDESYDDTYEDTSTYEDEGYGDAGGAYDDYSDDQIYEFVKNGQVSYYDLNCGQLQFLSDKYDSIGSGASSFSGDSPAAAGSAATAIAAYNRKAEIDTIISEQCY